MSIVTQFRKTILGIAISTAVFLSLAAPAHAAWTASVTFPGQEVGSTSAPINAIWTNTAQKSTTIVSVSISSGQFSYSGLSLPLTLDVGQSVAIPVTFSPSATQVYTATLTIVRSQGANASVGLSGTGIPALPPAITTQPVNQTLIAGQTATFGVAATSTFPMTYQWSKNGAAIRGAVSSTYTTPITTSADNGAQFNVLVSNIAGHVTSTPATLTVNVPPTITTQPSSQTITVGQTAMFTVAATGTTPMSYQWMKNGTAISGATSSSYTAPVTTFADNGAQFKVLVSNIAGNATSAAATLTVNVPPTITTQPSSQAVTAGQTATFTVAATGTSPMTYQWMKNGAAISGAMSSSYTTPATTTSDNAAKFTVVTNNSAGSATSTAATLTVNSASSGCVTSSGTWVNSPLSQTATGSFRVTFDATPSAGAIDGVTGLSYGPASAYTNLAAIVRFNDAGNIDAMNSTAYTAVATIPYSAGITYHFIMDVNTVAHTYSAYVMIGSVQTTIGSNLAFRAEQATTSSLNNVGAMSSIASQTVCNAALSAVSAVAPAITTQPASKTVTAGQTATFSVTASGTSPMTYQWKKNGTAVSGATSSSYTTPSTATSDNNAQFTVTVSNSAGSANSTAATLTVSTSTVLLTASTTSLSFGSVNLSSSTTQNVTLTNAGSSNVTVSSVSISGAGFTASGVPTGTILTPGQTATLSATFTPASAGSSAGTVTVSSNATNSPDTISLSGTGVSQVNHSVSLSWTPSTSTVVGYNSYSSTTSGGPYTKLTSNPIPATSFTDTTVKSGLTYYYVVTAVNSSNVESAFSQETSATIP
jgi:Abnormal spindle-like microcephaly-assoc'd, ASPM-SPD-2-Hydin/Immunoglobulin domain/Immunoglobulin I-set domain